MNNNRCVVCNAVIPEGRQICPICEKKAEKWRETYDIAIMRRDLYFHRSRFENVRPLLIGLIGVYTGRKYAEFFFDTYEHYMNAVEILNREFTIYTLDKPVMIPDD